MPKAAETPCRGMLAVARATSLARTAAAATATNHATASGHAYHAAAHQRPANRQRQWNLHRTSAQAVSARPYTNATGGGVRRVCVSGSAASSLSSVWGPRGLCSALGSNSTAAAAAHRSTRVWLHVPVTIGATFHSTAQRRQPAAVIEEQSQPPIEDAIVDVEEESSVDTERSTRAAASVDEYLTIEAANVEPAIAAEADVAAVSEVTEAASEDIAQAAEDATDASSETTESVAAEAEEDVAESAAAAANDLAVAEELRMHDETRQLRALNPIDELVADEGEKEDAEEDAKVMTEMESVTQAEMEAEVNDTEEPGAEGDEAEELPTGPVDETLESPALTRDSNPAEHMNYARRPWKEFGVEPPRSVLVARARLWHLHRERRYTDVIEQFDSMVASTNRSQREAAKHHTAAYHYLHSLAQLNQYHRILQYFEVCNKTRCIYSSPAVIDIVLTACMREPKGAPTRIIYRALKGIDARHAVEQAESKSAPVVASADADAKAAAGTPPAHAGSGMLITEKVANSILKALLLADEPHIAYDVWRHVILGEDDPFQPNAVSCPYRPLAYRLHSQSSHGLIMFMITEYEEMTSERVLSVQSSVPVTAAPGPLVRAANANDVYLYLMHAFQMYLQTSFIEQVADTTMLMRIFNTTLRAVLTKRTRDSPFAHKRHAWLVGQIYRFILHHNETVIKQDKKAELGQATTTQEATSTSDSTTSATFSTDGDSPWSHPQHRSFIALNWKHHFQPLLHHCIKSVQNASEVPTATSKSDAVAQGGKATEPPTSYHDQVLAAHQMLQAVLYDVRLTYPDYSHLRAEPGITPMELAEIDALEQTEAIQQQQLNLARAYETSQQSLDPVTSGSAKFDSSHFEPLAPLRAIDAGTCEALLSLWVQAKTWSQVRHLYASLPALKRYDAMRQSIIARFVQTHRADPSHWHKVVQSGLIGELQTQLKRQTASATWKLQRVLIQKQTAASAAAADIPHEMPAESNQLPLRTTMDLFDKKQRTLSRLTTAQLGTPIHSTLSFMLQVYSQCGPWHGCLGLFNDLFTQWKVQPHYTDYEAIIRATGKEPQAIDVLLSIDSALDLDVSLRPLPFSTSMTLLNAYTSLTCLAPRAHRDGVVTDTVEVPLTTLGAWTPAHINVITLRLARMYERVRTDSIAPLLKQPATSATINQSLVAGRVSLAQLLRFIQTYLAFSSQHGRDDTYLRSKAAQDYHLLLHRRDTGIPIGQVRLRQIGAGSGVTRQWRDLMPTDVLVQDDQSDAAPLCILAPPLAKEWRARATTAATITPSVAKIRQTIAAEVTTSAPVTPRVPSPPSKLVSAPVSPAAAVFSPTLTALRSGVGDRRKAALAAMATQRHKPRPATAPHTAAKAPHARAGTVAAAPLPKATAAAASPAGLCQWASGDVVSTIASARARVHHQQQQTLQSQAPPTPQVAASAPAVPSPKLAPVAPSDPAPTPSPARPVAASVAVSSATPTSIPVSTAAPKQPVTSSPPPPSTPSPPTSSSETATRVSSSAVTPASSSPQSTPPTSAAAVAPVAPDVAVVAPKVTAKAAKAAAAAEAKAAALAQKAVAKENALALKAASAAAKAAAKADAAAAKANAAAAKALEKAAAAAAKLAEKQAKLDEKERAKQAKLETKQIRKKAPAKN